MSSESSPVPVKIVDIEIYDSNLRWLGYKITMSDPKKNIEIKMDSNPQCCEVFDIHSNISPTTLSNFIGAIYQDIIIDKDSSIWDNYMNQYKTDLPNDSDIDCIINAVLNKNYDMNIRIITDKGELLFGMYNQHNGYYPHDCVIDSEKGYNNFTI